MGNITFGEYEEYYEEMYKERKNYVYVLMFNFFGLVI